MEPVQSGLKWLRVAVVVVGVLALGAVGGVLARRGSAHPVALIQRTDATATTTTTAPAVTTTTQAPVATTLPASTPPVVAANSAASSANQAAQSAAAAAGSASVAQSAAAAATATTVPYVTPTSDPPPVTYCAGSLAADEAAPSWPGTRPADLFNVSSCTDPVGTFNIGEINDRAPEVAFRVS